MDSRRNDSPGNGGAGRGTITKVPGAGHLANIENPEAFNAALTAFVDGLPA